MKKIKETHEQKVVRAHKCANRVVAFGSICAGCNLDAYCQISQKFAARRKLQNSRMRRVK